MKHVIMVSENFQWLILKVACQISVVGFALFVKLIYALFSVIKLGQYGFLLTRGYREELYVASSTKW